MKLKKCASVDIECEDFSVFLRRMRESSVDLLLTDPPYVISRETGFTKVKNGVKRFAVSMDFGKWDKKNIDLETLSRATYRVLRKGGTAIIWYDLWKLSDLERSMRAAGFKMIRLLIWQKTNPVPLNSRVTYLSNSREIAVVAVKGSKPVFNRKYHSGVFTYPIPRHKGEKIHPTQKPLDLFKELVEIHSLPGGVVLDPFLGSGTTAVAALQTGRKFLGCDKDEAYVQDARKRVDKISAYSSCKASLFLQLAKT